MKSLTKFSKSIEKNLKESKDSSELISEKEYSTVTYATPEKVIAVVDPYTGSIKWKRQRIGRIVIGASKTGGARKREEANTSYADTKPTPEYSVSDMTSDSLNKESVDTKTSSYDPPYVLVLKRQSIRQFPNNTKVALYYSDKLKKTFSVPYGPKLNSVIQAESVLKSLYEISENSEIENWQLNSGEIVEITQNDAQKLLIFYEQLNKNNQKLLLNKLCESSESFNKILNFMKDK